MAPPKMKPVAAAAVAPRAVKARPMGRGTFVPSVKLDPSQIADMRGFKPMSNPKTPGPYAGPAPIRPAAPLTKARAQARRPALKTAPGLKADKVGQVSKYPSSKEGKALSTFRLSANRAAKAPAPKTKAPAKS